MGNKLQKLLWDWFFSHLAPNNWNGSNSNVWNVNGSNNPGNLNNNNVDNSNAVRVSISLEL